MGLLDAPGLTLSAGDARYLQQTQRSYDQLDAVKTAALRTAYAKLGMRDSQPFDWLAIGDSTTEGARATNNAARWITRVQKQLRARMGQAAAGGYGYVPAWYSTGDQQTPSPSQFSSSGTDTGSSASRGGYGLGRRCLAMNGTAPNGPDKVTLTLTAGTATASTSVDVIYAKATTSTSGLDIYLDGSLLTSINTVSATQSSGNRYRISGLAGGSHVIEARATGQVAYLCGFMLYNGDETSGIRTWDAASSGSNSAYHALIAASSKGTPNFVYTYDDWVAIQPSLVTIMLGINDYYNSSSQTQTPAQYGANLTSIIANVRAACTTPPSIVLIPQWERGAVPGAISSANAWSTYLAQAYAVALADGNVSIFDVSRRFPPGVQTIALNLINGDFTHATDQGNAFMADAFVNWFLPR